MNRRSLIISTCLLIGISGCSGSSNSGGSSELSNNEDPKEVLDEYTKKYKKSDVSGAKPYYHPESPMLENFEEEGWDSWGASLKEGETFTVEDRRVVENTDSGIKILQVYKVRGDDFDDFRAKTLYELRKTEEGWKIWDYRNAGFEEIEGEEQQASEQESEGRPDLYVANGSLEGTDLGNLIAYVTVTNGGDASGSATLRVAVTIFTDSDSKQYTRSRDITLDAGESQEYKFEIDVSAVSSLDPNKQAELDTALDPHY